MPRPPSVSVVIPTHDRAGVLVRAIDSVLTQTMRNLELIVVDDASEDDTLRRVRAIEDDRLRLLIHEDNRGASAARNTGIRAARAPLVAFLDSDDEWLPHKLQRQLSALDAAPASTGAVCAWATWFDHRGEQIDLTAPRLEGPVHTELLHSCWVGTNSALLVRRADLDHIGGFDEGLPASQDWDLCIRLARTVDFVTVPEVLLRYSTSGERISTNLDAMIQGHAAILDKHGAAIMAQGPALEAVHRFRLGSLMCLDGRMEEGRSHLAAAVRLNPRHPKYPLGWMAARLGPGAYRVITNRNRSMRRRLRRWTFLARSHRP